MSHAAQSGLWTLIAALLAGPGPVLLAAPFLMLPESRRRRLLPGLVSFAVGTLLGAAFLALLPRALERGDVHGVSATVLAGLLVFFLLERLLLWHHCHNEACALRGDETPAARAGALVVLAGGALHKLVDGVVIAAAFLADARLGVLTAAAVGVHAVPHALSDFAVLLHGGWRPGQTLLLTLGAGTSAVLGAGAALWGLGGLQGALPYALALAAASFVYVALVDLLPGLHRRPDLRATAEQLLLIAAGVGVMGLTHLLH